ncbi:hypothetical protein [uncultured Clostridium sp.]|nr:hypothetical protein [uncultured Clostridium sp.]
MNKIYTAPNKFNKREVFGHWELITVVSNKECFATFVERLNA